jgi:UDP-N-acetylglucosamine 2-epimerase (non-hydrolysing)
MKVMSIFGTRPEMIKMWSTLKKLDNTNFEHIMVHTGQNFTKELRDFFFSDLKLRKPDYELNINTSGYAAEVSDVISKSDMIMEKVKPDVLLILGDTYSGLSVLPASHRGIKIFHMEAGLRAWDRRMPEQRNRILIDHISNILLPYNQYHRENLIREGIHPSKIIVTGNTTFETMRAFSEEINNSQILKALNQSPKSYILASAHRSENVDNPATLRVIIESLKDIADYFKCEVIFPVHPRTKSKINYETLT